MLTVRGWCVPCSALQGMEAIVVVAMGVTVEGATGAGPHRGVAPPPPGAACHAPLQATAGLPHMGPGAALLHC